jgi:hypothetical protein
LGCSLDISVRNQKAVFLEDPRNVPLEGRTSMVAASVTGPLVDALKSSGGGFVWRMSSSPGFVMTWPKPAGFIAGCVNQRFPHDIISVVLKMTIQSEADRDGKNFYCSWLVRE